MLANIFGVVHRSNFLKNVSIINLPLNTTGLFHLIISWASYLYAYNKVCGFFFSPFSGGKIRLTFHVILPYMK